MATRDGLAQIWYADANGVITGYTPTADNVASAIIDAYNEHFGTDINIWTPETKNLQVGDTVPNWNAYEKISTLVYIKIHGPGIAGYIKDETGFIYTKNNCCYFFNLDTGEVLNVDVHSLTDGFKNTIIGWVRAAGLNITQVEPKEENFEIGQVIQNWDEYVTI